MMHARDINGILSKIDEMRAVFVLGQRAVPLLEEVFVFLREIAPLMDDINRSIRETTAKMPRAASQLQSVSEATELATTEILDLVDAVLDQLTPLRQHLDQTAEHLAALEQQNERAELLVRETFSSMSVARPAELDRVWSTRRNVLSTLQQNSTAQEQALTEVRDRVNRIMISLQVQDITAQQLASVNHVIESIRARMAALVERLGASEESADDAGWEAPQGAYDPHARYDADRSRQEVIDDVLARQGDEGIPTGSGGSEDAVVTDALIDQLFASCDAEPPRPSDVPRAGDAVSTPASQAEIDALFQSRIHR